MKLVVILFLLCDEGDHEEVGGNVGGDSRHGIGLRNGTPYLAGI